jgi:hypothetical protein
MANNAITPKVIAVGIHPNYLYGMTTCFAITVGNSVPNLPSQHCLEQWRGEADQQERIVVGNSDLAEG